MRTNHLCILIHIRIKGGVDTGASFVDPFMLFMFVFVILSCLFLAAL